MLRIAALFLLFSSHAFGGVFIEPYVGYYKGEVDGKMTITLPAPMEVEGSSDQEGTAFGGRIGFGVAGVAMGVDYMHVDDESKDEDGDTTKNKGDNVGAFVAIPLIYSLRLNGTYFFNAKMKSDGSEVTGAGYKVGMGFNLFWRLNLNVDYISLSYDDADFDGFTLSKYSADSKLTMISLSLPLGE